jgi:hypothetical protein
MMVAIDNTLPLAPSSSSLLLLVLLLLLLLTVVVIVVVVMVRRKKGARVSGHQPIGPSTSTLLYQFINNNKRKHSVVTDCELREGK